MDSSTDFRFTSHAQLELSRRGITEAEVSQVITAPEQVEIVRPGRILLQSRVFRGTPPKRFLLRVIVEVDRQPNEVVTAYLTSKIDKYWRPSK